MARIIENGESRRVQNERHLGEALDKTDPDPLANKPKLWNTQKEMDSFESVVELLHPQHPEIKYPALLGAPMHRIY